MTKAFTAKKIIETWHNNRIIIVIESLIVGVLTGLVITAFRKLIDSLSNIRTEFYKTIGTGSILNIFVLIVAATCLGLFICFIIKKYPMIKGSGVSQIKGKFMKKLDLCPWPELPLKFLGGAFNISAGLSVGREGPSVQIGAYIGSAFEKIGRTSHIERVCLVTSGAAAGLASTFGAPFSGVIFAIEDLHQYLSPLLLTCVIAGAFAGAFISSIFFKAGPIFNFHGLTLFPFKYFAYLILLGILCALCAHIFKKAIYSSQKIYALLNLPSVTLPIIPYIISIPVCIFLPYAASGGDPLIEALAENSFPIGYLVLLLVIKIIFTGISAGSGAIGGIFVPLLSCGALCGIIFSKILVYFNFIESTHAVTIMVFAMAAFFAAVIKAPITAIILLAETSGTLFWLGGLVLSVGTSYFVANLINSPANDEVLLNQILNDTENNTKVNKIYEEGKQIFEVLVSPESLLDGKCIHEIPWPKECLIVSIAHGEKEIIPDGSTQIMQGDRLIVLTSGSCIEEHLNIITDMASSLT